MVDFIEKNDEDYVNETMETLEALIEAPGIKDEELDVIGELLSNLSGAVEVHREIKSGKSKKDALNEFMKRVVGSID
jgi:nucleotide-binding universal stress UspA family protein